MPSEPEAAGCAEHHQDDGLPVLAGKLDGEDEEGTHTLSSRTNVMSGGLAVLAGG
jgi:hypothetical protein